MPWNADSETLAAASAIVFDNNKMPIVSSLNDPARTLIKKLFLTEANYHLKLKTRDQIRTFGNWDTVVLPNKKIFVYANTIFPRSKTLRTWIYDVETKKLTEGPQIDDLAEPTAAPISNKQVLLSGGKSLKTGQALKSCYMIDIETKAAKLWTSLASPRFDHSVLCLSNGNILVVGGKDTDQSSEDGKKSSIEILENSRQFKVIAGLDREITNPLLVALPNGGALILGGWNQVGLLHDWRWHQLNLLFESPTVKSNRR